MAVSSWEPDPTGRHQYRWWDGEQWTDQVADDGVQAVDPVSTAEAGLPLEAPPPVPPPPSPSPEFSNDNPSTEHPDLSPMLASKGRRLGALFLELLLAIVTLLIGWLIWSLIVYSRGQSPAKQVLKMRVIRLQSRQVASWGWMALRDLVLKAMVIFFFASVFLLGIIWLIVNGIVLLSNDRNQTVWDKMLKTAVVHDPQDRFKPIRQPPYPSDS
ncbi:MAG: RDD family protein [Acidimicrobiia bacterium]|nr:RDD family protein [Acidimicrobiia bacterium]